MMNEDEGEEGEEERITKLMIRLREESSWMQKKAARELGELGAKAKKAIPVLVAVLQEHENWKVREEIATTLGKIGSKEVVPILTQLLKEDPSWQVRMNAVVVLGKLGTKAAISALISILKEEDEDFAVRQAAAITLGELGGERAEQALIDAEKEENDYLHRIAARVLEEKRIKTAPALSLIQWLMTEERDYETRVKIANELGERGEEAKGVIPALEAIMEGEEEVASQVALALGKIGTEEAIQALFKAMKKVKSPEVQAAIISALGISGERTVVTALEGALEEASKYARWGLGIRFRAIEALGKIGTREAIAALQKTIETYENEKIRSKAIEALWRIGEKESVPSLIDTIRNGENIYVRRWAAEMLVKKSGKEARVETDQQAVLALIYTLKEENDPLVRYWIAFSLGRIAPMNALPALLDVINRDEIAEVRRVAVWALTQLGARETIPTLLKCLKEDKSPRVRMGAAEALGELQAREAIPELVEVLKKEEEEEEVRAMVAGALGRMGTEEVVPALLEVMEKREDKAWRVVSQKAEKALMEICTELDSDLEELVGLCREERKKSEEEREEAELKGMRRKTDILRNIVKSYNTISINGMTELLEFKNQIECQRWLLESQDEIMLYLEGEQVIIPEELQSDTEEAKEAIEKIVKNFEEFAKKKG